MILFHAGREGMSIEDFAKANYQEPPGPGAVSAFEFDLDYKI